jgi:hypothetical protein
VSRRRNHAPDPLEERGITLPSKRLRHLHRVRLGDVIVYSPRRKSLWRLPLEIERRAELARAFR